MSDLDQILSEQMTAASAQWRANRPSPAYGSMVSLEIIATFDAIADCFDRVGNLGASNV